MIIVAYKLFRERKDGSITSLFINKTRTLPIGEWVDAENIPTKGFAERPYWHCTAEPVAPHLKMKLKSGEVRVWKKIMMENFTEFKRPENQGGLWFLAKRIMIVENDDVRIITVYATHQTGIVWYLFPPNDCSYYEKLINESELINSVYINKK